MELNKLKIISIVLLFSISLAISCKPLKINDRLFLKSKFSSLIIEGNKFEYLRKSETGHTKTTTGIVKLKGNMYILNTYDSIISEQVNFRSIEFYKDNLSKDSVQIEVIAPINTLQLSPKNLCKNLPYIISFNKPLTSNEELNYFESTNFKVAKNDIYNVNIYPKTTCGYDVSMVYLFFILDIYNESTNYIEIELPDLNFNRFSYLNFKNYNLIKSGSNKYELRTNSEIEIFSNVLDSSD